jgi:hypothetical protein
MARKVKIKLFERMKNGTRRHVATIHGEGRTKALAQSNAKRTLGSYVKKNIIAGFQDATGFHAIRASADYVPALHGEKSRPSRKLTGAKQKKYLAGRGARARKAGALYSKHF